MTTPYGITTSKGSQGFSGYVNNPVYGPLTNPKYPFTMKYHNSGVLTGQRPTPPFFYPSQTPINSNMNTNSRNQYNRAYSISKNQSEKEKEIALAKGPIKKVIYSSQIQRPITSHMNYISPVSSSSHIDKLKSIAIGKTVYKTGLPAAEPISSKNYDNSYTRSSLRRTRSSGCVAPKKKGSIYNVSLKQSGINGWGSIPRQAY